MNSNGKGERNLLRDDEEDGVPGTLPEDLPDSTWRCFGTDREALAALPTDARKRESDGYAMGRCGVEADVIMLDWRRSESPVPEVDLGVKMRDEDG